MHKYTSPIVPEMDAPQKQNKVFYNSSDTSGFYPGERKSGMEKEAAEERDTRLMMRMKTQRDEGALRELMVHYQGPVYTMAYRLLGNAADAEDIAQRTFIRVWKAAPTYEPEARFTTWLFTIVKNLAFNESRRRKRKPASSLDAAAEQGITPAAVSTQAPDVSLEHKELEIVVEQALSQLSPKARMAVQLRRFEDLGYEDIAGVLGMTASATKSLLFRARRELRTLLADYL